MTHLMKSLGLLVVGLACVTSWAREFEGARQNPVLLNGHWGFARGDGDERAETAAGQRNLPWQPITLPGPFMKWNQEAAHQTKSVWARRRFQVTGAQAESLAVLRWNRIACGAVAFINGQKAGENEPTGPFQVIVPAGVLKPGDNQIVLKIRGAAGVRRSKSGNALIPAGFGVGMPEVTDDVWIDFADAAYVKWALALPDLAGSRVKIRVTPTGKTRLDDLKLVAQVKAWPDGKLMGEGHTSARLVPDPDPLGGEHFFVDVPMPGFEPWTYERCPLYTARVKLTKEGRTLDEVTFRFGMRGIGVQDRNYKLNGKNLWLRGSNLVFEWNWGGIISGKEQDYLVTEAREMSMNSFRTHTQPPPRLWCDVCDEHGTMILAEFPVLFNYQDYKFTPEEWDICKTNEGYEDVIPICQTIVPLNASEPDEVLSEAPAVGYVYLLKHGTRREYKIGRTKNPLRREGEIAVELPEKIQPIHVIKTDDPVGIENYWHTRFADKRKEGEWFALTAGDVRAFKRWKRIY